MPTCSKNKRKEIKFIAKANNSKFVTITHFTGEYREWDTHTHTHRENLLLCQVKLDSLQRQSNTKGKHKMIIIWLEHFHFRSILGFHFISIWLNELLSELLAEDAKRWIIKQFQFFLFSYLWFVCCFICRQMLDFLFHIFEFP